MTGGAVRRCLISKISTPLPAARSARPSSSRLAASGLLLVARMAERLEVRVVFGAAVGTLDDVVHVGRRGPSADLTEEVVPGEDPLAPRVPCRVVSALVARSSALVIAPSPLRLMTRAPSSGDQLAASRPCARPLRPGRHQVAAESLASRRTLPTNRIAAFRSSTRSAWRHALASAT